MLSFIELLVGLAILTVSADLLVRGSVEIAERLHIPPLIVGLTIIAFGTSTPELVVSLKAAFAGSGGIAIGNIVGSNIANILIVLGLPSIIRATTCEASGTTRNFAFMVFITLAFLYLCWDGVLTRTDGFLMLAMFAGFFIDQILCARRARNAVDREAVEGVPGSIWVAVAFTLAGLVSLPFAARAVVEGAIDVAKMYGVTETAIGVTLVALGTSLPELAATTMAALRGHSAIAIGNAIGSNIFNILAVMGLTATIIPVGVPAEFFEFEIWAMIAATLFLAPFVVFCWPIGRLTGIAMTLAYVLIVYIALGIAN